jgi:sulfate adenylyltransferase subunit 2
MQEYNLSHLKELEAEAIHIIREVAAEFENPVMLYSIGKDSSVMVRLAEKAFYPGKVPFPLMHIDSKWKFREMIEFRDNYARENNWDLIVHYNKEGFEAGVGPFTHGSKVHTDIMKTQALLEGLANINSMQLLVVPAATKKNREPKNVFSPSAINFTSGIPKTSAPNCGIFTTQKSIKVNQFVYFPFRTGQNWMSGNTFVWKTSPLFRCTTPKNARLLMLTATWIMVDDERMPQEMRDKAK